MPLADRNLFVAFKQERFAGKDLNEVRHVFRQLVCAVKHLHDAGDILPRVLDRKLLG
jgi:hypothetical protein